MTTFSDYVDALRGFQQREGHTRVPAGHVEDRAQDSGSAAPVNLGYWVSYIRSRKRAGLLPAERVDQIEQWVHGFEWGPLKPGPRPGGTSTRDDEIRAYRQNGMSLQKIGERYGLTRQRVHQIVKG